MDGKCCTNPIIRGTCYTSGMCSSFSQTGSIRILEEITRQTGLQVLDQSAAGVPEQGERTQRPYNEVLVIFAGKDGQLKLAPMYWQLIHYWEKEFKSKYSCFNVRAESLGKPHNEALLMRRRCVFPVAGFFESRKMNGRPVKPRQVFEFSLPGRNLMSLGGIYFAWRNPNDDTDRRLSCGIITVEPNETVAEVHNRMPLMIAVKDVGRWLDPGFQELSRLKGMIKPFGGELNSRLISHA